MSNEIEDIDWKQLAGDAIVELVNKGRGELERRRDEVLGQLSAAFGKIEDKLGVQIQDDTPRGPGRPRKADAARDPSPPTIIRPSNAPGNGASS